MKYVVYLISYSIKEYKKTYKDLNLFFSIMNMCSMLLFFVLIICSGSLSYIFLLYYTFERKQEDFQ